MNWVDLVVLALIVLSGLLAFMRGFVREVLGLGAWVIAGVAAYLAFPYLQPWLRQQFSDPTIADAIAIAGVFIIVLVLLSLFASAISGAIQSVGLGGLDRTLGLVFGLVRGALLVAAAYILVGLAVPVDQWPVPVLEARSLPTIYQGAQWVAGQVPPPYRPAISPPPPGRPTSAASLLQPNPAGRALAARPGHE